MSDYFEPGPRMDSNIATRLWGSIVVHDCPSGTIHMVGVDRSKVEVPKYSTEPNDVQRVTQFMNSIGFTLRIRHMAQQGEYMATFLKDDGRSYIFSRAAQLPMAICIASLAALDGINVRKTKTKKV